ncbi:MAG: hypothetical protein M1833_002635 [Piccolia ochrophora]|nr:MAG: hypothetical protein M1833_002635 [Piccolia ochrophora]
MSAPTASGGASVIEDWLQQLGSHAEGNRHEDPGYYADIPKDLISISKLEKLAIGTGEQLLSDIVPCLENAQQEVLFVTCFWAASASQRALASWLRTLAANARRQNRTIRVRICFSSLSLVQKLFQTSSLAGKDYSPDTWSSKLGLPSSSELVGLDIRIKSIFVRPFSVMHPKFIVVDRQRAFIPSCNLLKFWKEFWGRGHLPEWGVESQPPPELDQPTASSEENGHLPPSPSTKSRPLPVLKRLGLEEVQTLFLPSPHHKNPHFRLLTRCCPPPPTPLNLFILAAFSAAKKSIYVQTPNLTSPPVLSALLDAAKRGVDVHVVTSTRMMVLEQVVTAGTVTELCVSQLHRRHRRLVEEQSRSMLADPESGGRQIGELKIDYFHANGGNDISNEPVRSHLKLSIVDEEITILGSGNMDRASWYTSQELGLAFFSGPLAGEVKKVVGSGLEGRLTRKVT